MTILNVEQEEAFMVGKYAVKQSVSGVTGKMITLEREEIDGYKSWAGITSFKNVSNVKKNCILFYK